MQTSKVNSLNPSELDQVVDLHHRVLKESFINNFGKQFLKISYKTIFESKNNICLIVKDDSRIIGLLVATLDGNKFNEEVTYNNFFPLTVEILKSSLKNPALITELIKWQFKKPSKHKIAPELQFIALDPAYQKKGLGTKLINLLHKEFKEEKINQYRVGTKANNNLSNSFYKKLGFEYFYEDYFFGDKFNYYLSPKL